ncbi:hypothetical protein CLV51_104287 [Chitinophaga niastensis]|uniref:Uncharacterized protein n=1 Tax=Chitinophaga niastensis TaxID=536980 RepID=A0A2P8HHA2_CHINA|nr:hypothetical protein [Chitinophaga niastensis]PSL45581.1 hypothetical protein CLV51_104287 [Chitinophaga niastensis]
MFNNVAIDVAIGLVFIYLLYSLLTTIIQEIIAAKLSFRAKFLEKAIIRMLQDKQEYSTFTKWGIFINQLAKPKSNKKQEVRVSEMEEDNKKERAADNATIQKKKGPNSFAAAFYNHSLIKVFSQEDCTRKPAYLVSTTFSKIVLDLLKGHEVVPGENIRSKIQESLTTGTIKWNPGNINEQVIHDTIIEKDTKAYLNSIWADAQGDVEKFRDLMEQWFNETMDRTTGWYKKYTQFISLLIGLVLAIVFNVDTLKIADALRKDPKLREQLVQQAGAFVAAHPDLNAELQTAKKAVKEKVTADSSITKKDSVIKVAGTNLDKRYDSLKQVMDSLNAAAGNLVSGDIVRTRDILGTGIYSVSLMKTGEDWYSLNVLWRFLQALAGWIITALALSLGSPFWFDILNKLMKLRSSVAPAIEQDTAKAKEVNTNNIKRVG